MVTRIELHFGALAPSLKEQLEPQLQGIQEGIADEKLEHFQRDADAIVRLYVRGLIPDSIKASAYKKLAKNITAAIK